MSAKGLPTVWFTLSLANHRWADLQNLFGGPPPRNPNETDIHYRNRCNRKALLNYSRNPHIVDAMFVNRVKEFVSFFFGENCLNATWYWYRYEWQKRGNIHVHGLCRLLSDPGKLSIFNLIFFTISITVYFFNTYIHIFF